MPSRIVIIYEGLNLHGQHITPIPRVSSTGRARRPPTPNNRFCARRILSAALGGRAGGRTRQAVQAPAPVCRAVLAPGLRSVQRPAGAQGRPDPDVICAGHCNAEIAVKLFILVKTADHPRRSKPNVKTSPRSTRSGYDLGLPGTSSEIV
jgi:hypothetical protein